MARPDKEVDHEEGPHGHPTEDPSLVVETTESLLLGIATRTNVFDWEARFEGDVAIDWGSAWEAHLRVKEVLRRLKSGELVEVRP